VSSQIILEASVKAEGTSRPRGKEARRREGGRGWARGRSRVCVVTDNLGGQHKGRGGTSRQAKTGEKVRRNDHTAVSRKARAGAGAGQGKAGVTRQGQEDKRKAKWGGQGREGRGRTEDGGREHERGRSKNTSPAPRGECKVLIIQR
jgi:hypothetical protein